MKFIAAVIALLAFVIPSVAGAQTHIIVQDRQYRCTTPISQQATNGMPLRVTVQFSGPQQGSFSGGGSAWLGTGCNGLVNDPQVVELILDVPGDGRTFGPGDDAVRLGQGGPRDLTISGQVHCGPRLPGAHSDGVQVLGGLNVLFKDFRVGDYENGRSTCQGAGGSFFYSGDSTNVDVQGGFYIACNHSLNAGWPSPGANVTGASFRSGYATGDPVCAGYAESPPCIVDTNGSDGNPPWGGTVSNIHCDQHPFDTPPPPPPPDPVCSNGLDDDGDTRIDFPSDPGCANAEDGDEFNEEPPPPPYDPACRPQCDEEIDRLRGQVTQLTGENQRLGAIIADAIALTEQVLARLREG